MIYYAHKTESGKTQTVYEHCTNVANLAREFGEPFSLGKLCEAAGKYHDIGKYSAEFQDRLLENGEKVDHSSAGAIEVRKEFDDAWGMILAYVIAGHHSGLLDFGSAESGLIGRLSKSDILPDYKNFKKELSIQKVQFDERLLKEICSGDLKNLGFRLSFMVRMIYSALVDADFLDTEQFMDIDQHQLRQKHDPWTLLYQRFQQYMAEISNAKKSEINKKRNEIFASCINKGRGKPGFYTLTVPTGGGKTLSSMAFALEQHKDRIIYVIPYTSIIQQTAEIFRNIFGESNVLEHHSNYDFYKEGQNDFEAAKAMHLSSENWDIPITVTTNVQFFESLFANKSSRCRKIHRLANSVIILDEAQMIPLYYLKPCLLALEELVKRYGATVVFCTATKPEFPEGILSLQPTEIIDDPDALYQSFQRTSIEYIKEKNDEEITALINQEPSCLCIVNTKKHAYQLYENANVKNKYHLSGAMCHCHRDKVLKEVRERLKKGNDCVLFSTQLIECGVDISFPVVFRAISGLDSIIQSAGRCNRENELANENKLGKVHVFDPSEKAGNLRGYQQLTASCGKLIMEKSNDINNPGTISNYFRKLYSKEKYNLDYKNILNQFNEQAQQMCFNFETASRDFQLIENTDSLIIPYDEIALKLMREFEYSPGKSLLKKLQAYAINIYPYQVDELKERGGVKKIGENLYFLTTTEGFYNEETGLHITEMQDLIY